MTIQQLPQPKIELGKCPFCEKEIMRLENNQPVLLDGYSTFWILLSDQTRMKVAICEDCKKKLTKKKVDALMVAHQEFWKQGIADQIDGKIEELNQRKQDQINYYNNLNSVSFGSRERDLE